MGYADVFSTFAIGSAVGFGFCAILGLLGYGVKQIQNIFIDKEVSE